MTAIGIAAVVVYVIGIVGVSLGYLGYFRCHNETPLVTAGRMAFVALLWPLWAVILIGMALGL